MKTGVVKHLCTRHLLCSSSCEHAHLHVCGKPHRAHCVYFTDSDVYCTEVEEKGGVPVRIHIQYGEETEEVEVQEGDTVRIESPDISLYATVVPAQKKPSAKKSLVKAVAKLVPPKPAAPKPEVPAVNPLSLQGFKQVG